MRLVKTLCELIQACTWTRPRLSARQRRHRLHAQAGTPEASHLVPRHKAHPRSVWNRPRSTHPTRERERRGRGEAARRMARLDGRMVRHRRAGCNYGASEGQVRCRCARVCVCGVRVCVHCVCFAVTCLVVAEWTRWRRQIWSAPLSVRVPHAHPRTGTRAHTCAHGTEVFHADCPCSLSVCVSCLRGRP